MIRRAPILIILALLLLTRASLSGIAPVTQETNSREILQDALTERGLSTGKAKELVDQLTDDEALELAQDQGLIDEAGLRGKFVVTFIIIGLVAGAVAATLLLAEDTDSDSD